MRLSSKNLALSAACFALNQKNRPKQQLPIKLGAGGLIRAYSNSVSQAIEQAGLVERVEQAILKIDVAYSLHDSLLYYLKQANLEIAEEEYGASVIVSVYVDESQIEEQLNQLTERFNGQLTIKKGPTRIHELPYQKQ